MRIKEQETHLTIQEHDDDDDNMEQEKVNKGKEIKRYQKKWLQHVQRMDTNRLPKQALQYKRKRTKKHRTTEEEMGGPTSS